MWDILFNFQRQVPVPVAIWYDELVGSTGIPILIENNTNRGFSLFFAEAAALLSEPGPPEGTGSSRRKNKAASQLWLYEQNIIQVTKSIFF